MLLEKTLVQVSFHVIAMILPWMFVVFSEEVQDQVDQLLDNVPQIDTLFTVVDKIGEG